MRISEAIDLIITESNSNGINPIKTNDKVIIGDSTVELTGIVTTFMATVDVIKKTIEMGANLIITHEPTWFNGRDEEDWVLEDEIYQLKKEMIKKANIVIWRFHDHMHNAPKDLIYQGFEVELGWSKFHLEYEKSSNNPLESAGVCYRIPNITLNNLLTELESKLGMEVVRFIGSKESKIEKVGLLLGGSALGLGDEKNPMKLMEHENLDAVICGDIIEWTLPAYIRDANMLGINKSMIVIGHAKSEEAGMKYLVQWISSFINDISINFVESNDPFQYYYNS